MKKRVCLGEISWLIGVLGMAIGVALVSVSEFGYSMIAAPVYLLYKRLGFLTFGTVEYLYQGVLLLLMCLIIGRFRPRYLCSFVTAVVYGLVFDLSLLLTGMLPAGYLAVRIVCFAVGELLITTAVVLFIHTDMAPAVYELFVKELVARYRLDFGRTKLCFDCVLLAFSVLLSILLFGPGVFGDFSFSSLGKAVLDGYVLEGIGIGTLIAALINGPMISAIDRFLSKRIDFQPAKGIGRLLCY